MNAFIKQYLGILALAAILAMTAISALGCAGPQITGDYTQAEIEEMEDFYSDMEKEIDEMNERAEELYELELERQLDARSILEGGN